MYFVEKGEGAIPEDKFQREVLDRLIRIETKQDATMKTVESHSNVISDHSERITVVEQRAKSAHHRIDGIFWGAGIIGGLAGTVVNFIATTISKTGGHS